MTLAKLTGASVALILVLCSAAAGDDAADVFEAIFGQRHRQVLSTRTADDDLALAGEMVAAVKTAKGAPKLIALLCNHAYDLAVRDPAGYDTAAAAITLLAEHVPDRAAEVRQKMIELRQRQYARARGAQRAAVGNDLIDLLLAQADEQVRARKIDDAVDTYRRALVIVRGIRSNRLGSVTSKLDAVLYRQRIEHQISQLEDMLAGSDNRAAIAEQIVRLYVLALDDPAAAELVLKIAPDDELKKHATLAANPLDKLAEADVHTLGQWYLNEAKQARPPAQPALYNRAHGYLRRYLELHDGRDVKRVAASLRLKQAEDALAKLGVKPWPLPGSAASVNPRTADAVKPKQPRVDDSPKVFDLESGLIAHWKLDGNAKDSSANAIHGALVGSTKFVPGRVGSGALRVDGKSFMVVTHRAQLNLGNPFTMSVWVRLPKGVAQSPWANIISKGVLNARLGIPQESPGVLHFGVNDGRGPLRLDSRGTNYNDGQWHHVAGVLDGNTLTLYIDGKPQTIKRAPQVVQVQHDASALRIGSNALRPNRNFIGEVDDVRLYSRALTAAQIAALARGGAIDLLALIDPAQDVIRGSWQRTPQGLVVSPGVAAAVTAPVEPRGDYELAVELTRLASEEGFNIGLPVGNRFGMLVLDSTAQGGGKNGGGGLTDINGQRFLANETYVPKGLITTGKRHAVIVRVTTSGREKQITVSLDGRQIIDWKGPETALSPSAFFRPKNTHALLLGAWNSQIAFHRATLTMLSGQAKLLRTAEQKAGPAAKVAPPALISPAAGAKLGNKGSTWQFNWTTVDGATEYEIHVIGARASRPVLHTKVAKPPYDFLLKGGISGANLPGWTWRVRAIVNGRPGPWSESRTFDVIPPQR